MESRPEGIKEIREKRERKGDVEEMRGWMEVIILGPGKKEKKERKKSRRRKEKHSNRRSTQIKIKDI